MIRLLILLSLTTSIILATKLPGKCPQVPGTTWLSDRDFNAQTHLLLGAAFSPEVTSVLFVEKNRHKNQYLSIKITEQINFELEYIPKYDAHQRSTSYVVGNTTDSLILDSKVIDIPPHLPCWHYIHREEVRL